MPKVRTSRAAISVGGLLAVVSASFLSPVSAGAQQAPAQATGGAFGYYTNVSIFRGASNSKGPAPDVRLPPGGSAKPVTATEASAVVVQGPAQLFAGKAPPEAETAPPSGPITVSTKGTAGPGGSVTSSVDIVLRNPPDPNSPGGWGPLPPNEGDELHSTCTADEKGATGSARFVNARLSKSTDADGNPTDVEPVPDHPPVNYTREGVLTHIGDRYRVVYNEQFLDSDGSITVNAVHLYMLGDIAVGEQILGQVRCSVTGAAFSNTPPAPPTTAGTVSTTATSTESDSGASALPFVLGGLGAVAVVVVATLVSRRRRLRTDQPPP